MLAAGFLSGTVLNLVNHRLQIDELPWTDPVIWTSSLLLAWLATAAIFGVVVSAGPAGTQGGLPDRGQLPVSGSGAGLRLFLPSVHSPRAEVGAAVQPGLRRAC